jgi:signal peptidase I
VYHAGFEITAMTSDSMAPTLQGTEYENGDRILLEKISRHFRSPRRWEIYSFYNSDGIAVAKRIVALPGEKISIKGNRIYLNGIEIKLPQELQGITYYGYGNLADGREVDCGEGYFMLGDSSKDSYDSRFTGVVGKNALRGRAWCVVWPYARIGFVR